MNNTGIQWFLDPLRWMQTIDCSDRKEHILIVSKKVFKVCKKAYKIEGERAKTENEEEGKRPWKLKTCWTFFTCSLRCFFVALFACVCARECFFHFQFSKLVDKFDMSNVNRLTSIRVLHNIFFFRLASMWPSSSFWLFLFTAKRLGLPHNWPAIAYQYKKKNGKKNIEAKRNVYKEYYSYQANIKRTKKRWKTKRKKGFSLHEKFILRTKVYAWPKNRQRKILWTKNKNKMSKNMTERKVSVDDEAPNDEAPNDEAKKAKRKWNEEPNSALNWV